MSITNPGVDVGTREDDDGEADSIGLEGVKDFVGFFCRAPRRRPWRALAAFTCVAVVAAAVVLYWPRTYSTEVRILAEQNLVLPALGNPNRAVPRDADKPTRSIGDTILRRENVIALVHQLDLVHRWDVDRTPALRLKDRLMETVFGPMSEDDKLHSIVAMLERDLHVWADETSVTISVDWPNPGMAYEIASTVQKNFLEAHYDSNAAVIGEAIAILEQRSKLEVPNVENALAELLKVENDTKPPAAVAPAPSSPSGGQAPQTSYRAPAAQPRSNDDAEVLGETRRKIRQVEDDQQRRLSEARGQLTDAQSTLGPLHPTVDGLKRKVDTLDGPLPELTSLKAEERSLVSRLASASTTAPAARYEHGPGAQPLLPRDAAEKGLAPVLDDGPTGRARAKLSAATGKYNDVLGRLEAAQIELDVSRASFKYKYSLVRPPEVPGKARKPKVFVVVLAGLAGAIMLALLVAGLTDLAAGRFLEAWQVRRRLRLPILGEISPKAS